MLVPAAVASHAIVRATSLGALAAALCLAACSHDANEARSAPARATPSPKPVALESVFIPRASDGSCRAPYEPLSRSCVHPVQRLRRNEQELLSDVSLYERGAASPILSAEPPRSKKVVATGREDADEVKRERLAALDRMLESLRQKAEQQQASGAKQRKDKGAKDGDKSSPRVVTAAQASDPRVSALFQLLGELSPDQASEAVDDIEERGLSLTMDEQTWQELAKTYRVSAPGLAAE